MSPKNIRLELLPSDIKVEVVDLNEFGVNEWAIPARHALTASRAMAGAGLALLGGDYWLRSIGSFQPAADGWACSAKHDESWDAFVAKTLGEAERAIALRSDAYAGLDPYLVLVAASETDFATLRLPSD